MAVLGSALTLALIAYAAAIAFLYPGDGMLWDHGFKVNRLLPGGPAERANIQLGDRILAIEGYPVSSWNLPVMRWRSGDVLKITLERNGERLVAPVKLESLSLIERWSAVTPLVIAFSFWAVGSLTLRSARRGTPASLFWAFSQVMSAVLAAGALSGSRLIWAVYLFRVMTCAAVPLTLHFHLVLPGVQLNRRWRTILWAVYAVGVALALPYLWTGLVTRHWSAGWEPYTLRILTILAPSGVILASLIWLVHNYVSTRSPDMRRLLRLVVLGFGWGFVPLFLLSLLPNVVTGTTYVPYSFTMPFLALIPIVYWYATMRFDLLRADLVLNRSLVYLTVAIIMGGAYILTARLVTRFLPGLALSREAIGALLLAAASVALFPLRNLTQRVIDRAFYGGSYDYRSVVSNVSRSLTGTLDRRALEELLLERASDTLWARGAALLLPESHSNGRLSGRQYGAPIVDASLLNLETDGPLARCLCAVHRPVETPWLQQELGPEHLDPSEAMLLGSDAIRWWVPMVSDGQLRGLLLLGQRVGGEQFAPDDVQILSTLGDQAALAIKNILLVEELRSRLEEIESSHEILERMHQQLLIVREEERKRLARDLHDSPVQKLVALRYQLRECALQANHADLRNTLGELRDEAGRLLDELRDVCTELRPPLLDTFGLASAIRAHSEEVGGRHGLKTTLVLDDDGDWQLREDMAVSLFRIYQEALSNVIRHANASHVTVRLHKQGPKVTLEIQDDGRGFIMPDAMGQLATEGHFGLLGIRERVESVEGEFEVVSHPGDGTMLRIWIPVQPSEQD